MNLEEFLSRSGLKSQGEVALGILYYKSRIEGVRELSPKGISEAFGEASQPVPGNISQVLSSLRKARLVNRTKGGNYSLTILGKQRIYHKMQESGIELNEEVAITAKDISEALHKATLKITDDSERKYVEEAIRCLHPPVTAYRAAVLMGWMAVIYHLRKKVETVGFNKFNLEFASLYPQSKRKTVKHFNDLEDYKDQELLEVCERLRLYDKSVKKALLSLLDLRNGCAHPTDLVPSINVVKAFFEQALEYVLTK